MSSGKPAISISDQIKLLKKRGMLFQDEIAAHHFLYNISYYRLKGYWWDMQSDRVRHSFKANTYFESVIDRYNFDRHLRLILFDGIERIEIALRTKMIYHLSLAYGPYWYKQKSLFSKFNIHTKHLEKIFSEFDYSQEIFIKDHKRRFRNIDPEAWKIMEIASMGTLSKFYKNLNHQLPEKAAIAKGMGLQLHSELSSWLEAITYLRNIIAHHSRLWNRTMVKKPKLDLNNPQGNWLDTVQYWIDQKRAFSIICSLLYLCDHITPSHSIRQKLLELISKNSHIPMISVGFHPGWEDHPIWS